MSAGRNPVRDRPDPIDIPDHELTKRTEDAKHEAHKPAPLLRVLRASRLRLPSRLRGPNPHGPNTPRARLLILAAVLALLALLALLGRGLLGPRDRVWARIQETGVWRVALDPSFPPFENVDAAGRIAGLDPDLAAAIAADWGVRLEIVSLGFDELMDAVAAEQVDTALSALPLVPHRTEELHFSEPYIDAGLVLVVPLDSSVRSPADLAGRRLAAEWGSAGDAEARSLQERHHDSLTLALRDTMTSALDVVLSGEADAAVVDAITLALYPQRDRLRIAGEYLTREPYVAVVPARAPELLAALNASLRRLESNGTLDGIRNRWLRPATGSS